MPNLNSPILTGDVSGGLHSTSVDKIKARDEIAALDPAVAGQLETDARYATYLRRQDEDVAILRREEAIEIPQDFDFSIISGLSTEIRQKLERHRPATIAQAGRIDGMTPAALLRLMAAVRKSPEKKSA